MLENLTSDDRSIKKAFITSAVSKVITIIIQLFSFPLAIKALGVEQFGIYVVITSFLAWFNLGTLGILPGLSREISKKIDDDRRTMHYVYSAIHIVTITIFVIVVIVFLAKYIAPSLFYEGNYSELYFSKEISHVWYISFLFVLFNVYGGVAESVRLGKKEQHINNIVNIIGNVISLFSILFVAFYSPNLFALIFAVVGVQSVAKFINLLTILVALNKSIVQHVNVFIKADKHKGLLNIGLVFFLGEMLGIASTQGLVFIIGQSSGPVVVSYIAFIFKFMALTGGVVLMVTQPLSSVLMNLNHKKEFAVLFDKVITYYVPLFSLSIIISLLIYLFGQSFFSIWSSGEVRLDPSDILIISLYFIVVVFNHLIFTYLFSVGMTKRPVVAKIMESTSIILVVFSFRGELTVNNVLFCITMFGFLFTSVPYFCFFLKHVSNLKNKINC